MGSVGQGGKPQGGLYNSVDVAKISRSFEFRGQSSAVQADAFSTRVGVLLRSSHLWRLLGRSCWNTQIPSRGSPALARKSGLTQISFLMSPGREMRGSPDACLPETSCTVMYSPCEHS